MTQPIPEREEALHPETLNVLRQLSERPWALDDYLAGSAALTAYLGHRKVRDLDLMGYHRLSSPERRDLLQDLLAIEPELKVETARDGYLFVRFPASRNHVGLRLFYYPYPLIDPEESLAGMSVASATDLGLMKLGAVTSRGSRKDFIDLFLLCRLIPLETLLDRAEEKFGHVRDFPLQALKGLADVDAARQDPMPTLEIDLDWQEVENWLQSEVRDVARHRVGLDS